MNLNRVILIGNMTRDPEIRTLPSGQPVASFGLATNRMWKNKDGNQQKQTEFHNIVMFGRLAEIAQQYLKKGASIMVEGRIQTRSWQGQDGAKKYKTEIVTENMQMGPKRTFEGNSTENPTERQDNQTNPPQTENSSGEVPTVEYPEDEINPNDIPF